MSSPLWVGSLLGKRLLVFDPTIQPNSDEFAFLYSVQGHKLCTRKRDVDRKKLKTVKLVPDIELATEQYLKWLSMNEGIVAAKLASPLALEQYPLPNIICPTCAGSPVWVDSEGNRPTYGYSFSEGGNKIDVCPTCEGRGNLVDLL